MAGIDGSGCRFSCYNRDDRSILMREWFYYKDDAPISRGSNRVVPFRVINEVGGDSQAQVCLSTQAPEEPAAAAAQPQLRERGQPNGNKAFSSS